MTKISRHRRLEADIGVTVSAVEAGRRYRDYSLGIHDTVYHILSSCEIDTDLSLRLAVHAQVSETITANSTARGMVQIATECVFRPD